MVKFKFNYPKEYKGKKFHKNGETIEVSEESARIFTDRGIGKVIGGKDTDDTDDTDDQKDSGKNDDTATSGKVDSVDPNAGKVVGSTGPKSEGKSDKK